MNQLNNNQDLAEIHKFDQLAFDWWNPTGKMQPLHQLNPLRLQFIQNQVNLAQKTVLDVGCGGGILSESLANQQAFVTGIDLSEAVITVAKQHAEQNQLHIDYQLISIEELAEQTNNLFDVITCMELLEHVPNPELLIKSCANLIKPGGLLFFSTINRNFKAFLATIVAAEYIFNMLPKGTHEYGKFIRPSELTSWAAHANLELTALQGMTYQPWSRTFKLSNDTSVNYIACYEKQN